jgi:hypothetical protein
VFAAVFGANQATVRFIRGSHNVVLTHLFGLLGGNADQWVGGGSLACSRCVMNRQKHIAK